MNSSLIIAFTFRQIPVQKVWTPLSSQLWVKLYHYYSSRRKAFALNNLQRLCCIVTIMIHIQLYTYTCGSKINNNDELTHFFRKIYLSHFIRNGCERVVKGICVRGELETGQTATYWPPIPLSLAALLSHSGGLLNQGSWGPIALCWVLVLSTGSYLQLNWLQLTEPVCCPRLYNCLMSTCFLWASHLHPIQPIHSQGYTLISSTGCTCSLIDGWVGGQYVTVDMTLNKEIKPNGVCFTILHKIVTNSNCYS